MTADDDQQRMAEAIALLQRGELGGAENLLAQICEGGGDDGKAWYLRGAIRLQGGDTAGAIDFLTRAVELNPVIVDAHFTLGRLLLAEGRLAEAIRHIETVVELDQRHGEAWMALGSLYADIGRFRQAEQASRKATRLLPGIAEPRINLVNALITLGQRDEAIALCEEIRERGPAQAGIWHSLGLALQALGRLPDAEQCLTRATVLEPRNAAALCALGEVVAAGDDLSRALILYRKSLQLQPDNARVHFQLGKLLLPHSSAGHRRQLEHLRRDHRYRDVEEARQMARELARGFRCGDADAERALGRFFDAYDPSRRYTGQWWRDALASFGDPRRAPDTALRSVYSAVFSWSLPGREALDEIAAFAGDRLASYGSGSGYWEYLLATHYGCAVRCHDIELRHRFVPTERVVHADVNIDPEECVLLAWLPGELELDPAIESLLLQLRRGQKLVIVGEPADRYGQPRSCGTRRFFQLLAEHFETRTRLSLPNYAYFEDRVDLLLRK